MRNFPASSLVHSFKQASGSRMSFPGHSNSVPGNAARGDDLPADIRGCELRPLVRQCLAGDQTAMLALVERFRGQVFGLCYRMLGQRQDAEDAAQETFVRVLKNLHRWDEARDFQPWLLAIAGNRCRTALSSRKRRPVGGDALMDQVADDAPDQASAQHLAEEVHLALAGVRIEYRQAFVLFHEHELSYAEIAESMAVPLGTVKTWVHRARRELIEALRRRGAVPEARLVEARVVKRS
jgi:RNA polymerase sigma-70 factor, ECF subfamily